MAPDVTVNAENKVLKLQNTVGTNKRKATNFHKKASSAHSYLLAVGC